MLPPSIDAIGYMGSAFSFGSSLRGLVWEFRSSVTGFEASRFFSFFFNLPLERSGSFDLDYFDYFDCLPMLDCFPML